MRRMLMGVETEYALAGVTRSGTGADLDLLVSRLMSAARRAHSHLSDARGAGIFLENGARLYVDCGRHPEFATPECPNPWEVLRYVAVGERLLRDAVASLPVAEPNLTEVALFRCNVDYSGSGATWGRHESYLHRSDPAAFPAQLVPHLVSRVIYAGAGGFNPSSLHREFTLSPRAWLLERVVSHESTQHRPIFHTKDESLSGGAYHRLHVIAGESLCSETATLLTLGATALVVAAIDAGRLPGDAVKLESPLEAMRTIAGDPTCAVRVRVQGGRELTAIEIQRHFLEEVEACRGRGCLPEWAESITELWGAMLDRLEEGPASVERTLDWAIKHAIYAHRDRHRHQAERAAGWSGAVQGILPLFGEKRVSRPSAGPLMRLSQDMLEADWRFGQLGARGVFEQLDRGGRLAHRILGPGEVERGFSDPPSEGRARLRGEWVRRLAGAGKRGQCLCDWSVVWDRVAGTHLDLKDPFCEEAEWRPMSRPHRAFIRADDWFAAITATERTGAIDE